MGATVMMRRCVGETPAPSARDPHPRASPRPLAAPGVPPISKDNCPQSHPIKGNHAGRQGERLVDPIYHVPGGRRTPLAMLAPQQVQKWMNDKRAAGLSPRTVCYLPAVLRKALGQTLKWGEVARNVATLIDPPRMEEKDVEPFTPDECRKILKAVRGERLEALYTVALALRLRQGEALGLHRADVDLDAATLRVRVQLPKIDGEFRFTEPKSKTSLRAISLPAFAVTALREHRVRQLEERLRAGDARTDSGLVFTSSIGTPLFARNVSRSFHALLDRAGIDRRGFHSLRHSAATLLLLQGVRDRVALGPSIRGGRHTRK